MEQNHVYLDLNNYNNLRLIQQSPEEQMVHQQQLTSLMSPNQVSRDLIVQGDQVLYSSLKPNEQYITQQDESMQGQYLIQSPQQVFYTNVNSQNQNRIQNPHQQTITLNQNIISQQNEAKLVLQPTKVVVQRNADLLQSRTNITATSDQQIQYHLNPNMEQTQTYQIIQHPQPIKQTIYPQSQVNQQYLQLPQQSTKILMQCGNQQIQHRFISKPQQVQQIQVPSGHIMQINQQPQQHRPRLGTPTRFQVRLGPQPQSQMISISNQRTRNPRNRFVRPTQTSTIQSTQQQKPPQQGSKVYYLIQTQPEDGSQMPQLIQNSPQAQSVVRLIQQKVSPATSPPQQLYQLPHGQLNNSNQGLQQNQSQSLIGESGDCDDLEDSITATAISKASRSEPPPLHPQSISGEDYKKNILNPNSSRVGVVKPMINTTGNQIRSPTRNPALQVIRQRPIQRQFLQQGVNLESEVAERESAKMLVILDNGEQRLITFTLPKETCTVQELLDQVGIKVGADSNIECIENPGSEIDYIVRQVGNFASRDTAAMTKAAENHIRQQQRQSNINQRNAPQNHQLISQATESTKSKSPEPKVPAPKYVTGFYAVCAACGCSGIDHAKCVRCNRIFTEEPKVQRIPPNQQKHLNIQSIASSTQTQKIINEAKTTEKKDQMEALQKKHQISAAHRQHLSTRTRGGLTTSTPRVRAPKSKTKIVVPEIVTLSSDDESGSDESKSSAAKALALKKEDYVTKKPFEPEIVDDIVAGDFIRLKVDEFSNTEHKIVTSISCRTIRIGSFKFDSKEKVLITSKGVKIVAPSINHPTDLVSIHIQHSEIVKVVTHFSKQLHIIFLYTKPSCARYIVEQLQMPQPNDKSPFYSPISRHEPLKKIVFLADGINDETKSVIKSLYNNMILEEINNRDANEMLVRSTGIPLSNTGAPISMAVSGNNNLDGSNFQEIEVKKLLIYPEGRGGISINTNDYMCLGSDLYLNDVIIDFYLKYIHHEILTDEQRNKTHIFSQFFYKRLTTMTKEKDPKMTAAQKRHARVASWTKNVNLFEKDFIIIPINEQSHWFLAIVCFPNLMEPHTMDTNQPIKLIPAQKRSKKKTLPVLIGNTTITPLTKKEESIHLADEETSERDEAEGDESDLGSSLESEDEEVIDQGQPVKVPCILIFDSLLGAPRSRVVATLRDYLTCEYKAKFPSSPPRLYTKLNLPGNQVKVPQQNNFTDCGLFLLQYVEQFFKDPIKDYRIPIKSQQNWFHQDLVTRKREDIAKLLQQLIKRSTPDGIELPEIEFPTKDGVILEQEETKLENAFNDDDYVATEEDLKEVNQNGSKFMQLKEETKRVYVTKKRSLDKNDSSSGESSAKTPKINARNKP